MTNHVHNNNKLMMNLYVERIGIYIPYTFKRVPDGWYFDVIDRVIVTDRDALEFFEYLRIRDQFSYSPSIGCYFEYWWEDIADGIISFEELQDKINELSCWLSQCEISKPKW